MDPDEGLALVKKHRAVLNEREVLARRVKDLADAEVGSKARMDGHIGGVGPVKRVERAGPPCNDAMMLRGGFSS